MKSFIKWAIGVLALLVIAGVITGVVILVASGGKDFKDDFKFGAATSSYQIEGAWDEDGKVENIWDNAVHNFPNAIRNRETGDVAADSYHLYKEDVKAMKSIGLQFYRFSISWARIIPNGGSPNPLGIKYYNDLINELIANDIEPLVTLYHWDLPQYLQDLGGWTSPTIIDHFEHYAEVLFENFGDRVKQWITFNEPYIFCTNGYGTGYHAPLIVSPGLGEYECAHNVLLSHAKTYHMYKNKFYEKQQGKVGICLYSAFFYPGANETQALADQAVEHMLGWFANPIFSKDGDYPKIMKDNIKKNSDNEGRLWSRLPAFTEEEKKSLIGTSDFLALNYYTSRIVYTMLPKTGEFQWQDDTGIVQKTDPSWHKGKSYFLYSVPRGLHDLLVWIKNKYSNPMVMITENGYSDDGQLEDDDRITYIREHLGAIKDAIDDGCDVKGYTVWSLLDNFEWADGYGDKFGIFSVNYTSPTRERTAKKSSEYFQNVIKTRKY